MSIDAELVALIERPRFKERARQAVRVAKEEKAAAWEQERATLRDEAVEWMQTSLGMLPGEIATIEFSDGKYSEQRPCVNWTVDGVQLRVRHGSKSMDLGGYQFGRETIYEDYPIFEMHVKTNIGSYAWQEVKTLADIGARIR